MKYFLIAGEKSGDLHGSNLLKAIKKRDNEAFFKFIGGDEMSKVGGPPFIHIRDLAIMGLLDVLKNIFEINRILKRCKNEILKFNPDVIVLIDFAGFNLRIARFAKSKKLRVFYYISPKVWAWNTSRAWKLKKYTDRMFVILPFEKAFYKQFEYDVDYVGNPVVDAVIQFDPDHQFLNKLEIESENLVAVLPGSRKQELIQMIPILKPVIEKFESFHFLVAKVDSVPQELYASLEKLPNVTMVLNRTYDILHVVKAAIVTSGTATLETALFNVPQVVCYKTDAFSYFIGKRLVSVEFISLVNLIAGRKVVEELLQADCKPEKIATELQMLFEDGGRNGIQKGYKEIKDILGTGSASEKAASTMVRYLEESSLKER